jgi:hypothetical protein
MPYFLLVFCLFFFDFQLAAQADIRSVFASLSRAEGSLADYKLKKKRGQYYIVHRTLPLTIQSQYADNFLQIEERGADNSSSEVSVCLLYNSKKSPICAVIYTYSSDMEQESRIKIWQKQGKIWQNISASTLVKQEQAAAYLDNCAISVRQIATDLPYKYQYLPEKQQLKYMLDIEAIGKRCESKKQEQASSSSIAYCDVLACVERADIYYLFDAQKLTFSLFVEK